MKAALTWLRNVLKIKERDDLPEEAAPVSSYVSESRAYIPMALFLSSKAMPGTRTSQF